MCWPERGFLQVSNVQYIGMHFLQRMIRIYFEVEDVFG